MKIVGVSFAGSSRKNANLLTNWTTFSEKTNKQLKFIIFFL